MAFKYSLIVLSLIGLFIGEAVAAPAERDPKRQAQHQPDASSASTVAAAELDLMIVDSAKADPQAVARAMEVAAGIFARCGVLLRWRIVRIGRGGGLFALVSSGTSKRWVPLDAGSRATGVRFFIRLLPERFARRAAIEAAMGSSRGDLADVYYDRVCTVANTRSTSTTRSDWISLSGLLGHVIAHELGHVLLGPGNHHGKGIMQPNWLTGHHLPEMRNGLLLFTAEQSHRIREAAERMRTAQ